MVDLKLSYKVIRTWVAIGLIALLTAPLSPVHADSTPPSLAHPDSNTATNSYDSQPRRTLIAVSQVFAATIQLQYKSHVLVNDETAKIVNVGYDVDAKIVRPDNVNITVSDKSGPVAHIVTHHGVGYAFDPVKNTFIPIPSITNADGPDISLYLMAILGDAGEAPARIADEFLGYWSFDDLGRKMQIDALQERDDTLNGKKVEVIDQLSHEEGGSIFADHMYLDADMLRPMRISTTFTDGGSTQTEYQEDFSSFSPDGDPLADKDFDATPPAGAKELAPIVDLFRKGPIPNGSMAPFFEITDGNGKKVSTVSFIGSPVAIYFWTDGGEQLIPALPDFMRLAKSYQSQDIVFLAVGLADDRKAVPKYEKQVPDSSVTFAYDTDNGKDGASIGEELYNLEGFPCVYLLNKNGTIAASFPGYVASSSEDDLKHAIDVALQNK